MRMQPSAVILKLDKLKAMAEFRPAGYYEDVTSCGKIIGDRISIPFSQWSRLVAKYRKAWPMWATMVAALKSESDLGVGDTIARVIGPFGGDAFKAWTKSIGSPCKCDMRQAKLNALYPYE